MRLDLPTSAPTRPLRDAEPLTYKGERVMTTEMAAKAFGTDDRVIRKNFERNEARFENGKHFHCLTGSELKALKDCTSFRGAVDKRAPSLYLWTEKGIARHAKILETEAAWEIFEELEDTYFAVRDGRVSPAVPAIPNFADPAAAARAWAEQYEARVAAERTKAEIGSRREATAMATAARANQRANVLEIKLDLSSQYATVKRVQAATGEEFSWRPLRQMSLEMNLPAEEVPDANYGTVKAYHSAVWRQVYGIELSNLSDAAAKRN